MENMAIAGLTMSLTDLTDPPVAKGILDLPYGMLSLVAIVLMPADLCDAESCESFRAVCGSCRALRAFFAETRAAFSGTYTVYDSPYASAAAHRAGLVFDPAALSRRIARDFAFFPRMRSLLLASFATVGTDEARVKFTSLPLRCVALDPASARWAHRVVELSIRGSWLGTCAELAAFTSLRSLALVECRCHTVAGLAELDLDSLTVDALEFYAARRDGTLVGPVTSVGYETLAPILRARRLFVKRVPAITTAFAVL